MMSLRSGLGSRTFASLRRHRNYRLFFAGQVVSVCGTWMQNVAMYWLVLQLTDSPMAIGVLSFARFAPSFLLSPLAGTIADRLDNRRTVIGTQAVQMLLAAFLAMLAFTGHISSWQIDAVAIATGAVLCLDMPVRQALTFQLVGPRELPNAVALNATLFNAARVGGPAIAGLLVAVSGAAACFLVNAASFLAVLASLISMRREELFPLERDDRPSLIAGTWEGVRFVRSRPAIAESLILITVYASLLFNVDVCLPILTKQTLHRGPDTFALLTAAFGVGALSGGLVVAARGNARWGTAMTAALVLALVYLTLFPIQSVLLITLLLIVAGAAFATMIANVNAKIQLESPDHLRGRILSLYFYSWTALAPVGALITAWLCSVGTTRLAFAVVGTSGVATVAALQWHRYRADDARVDLTNPS